MIFDAASGALYGSDGKFIKTVDCPLALRPEQLKTLDPLNRDRFCESCRKTIRCIDTWSDEEVRVAVEEDKTLCIFATSKARNVVFLERIGFRAENSLGLPVVSSVRSLSAMQMAIACGHELMFMNVGAALVDGDNHYRVLRHKETGRLWWSCDYRMNWPDEIEDGPEATWGVVRDWFFVRSDRPFPLAAYVLPKGISAGDHVFIEDVIEDWAVAVRTQGDRNRVVSACAVWNGGSFEIDVDYGQWDFCVG
ncbi:hypothetical protein dqs_1076 [Azoarcus olearius]|nr:hypothetical protein dqs_1076 [Azoarcus olearius]